MTPTPEYQDSPGDQGLMHLSEMYDRGFFLPFLEKIAPLTAIAQNDVNFKVVMTFDTAELIMLGDSLAASLEVIVATTPPNHDHQQYPPGDPEAEKPSIDSDPSLN